MNFHFVQCGKNYRIWEHYGVISELSSFLLLVWVYGDEIVIWQVEQSQWVNAQKFYGSFV